LYLGYWIGQSRKMAYKINFQPMEGLINGQWQPLRLHASAPPAVDHPHPR
jgi:arginine-tRNA-protein transferase